MKLKSLCVNITGLSKGDESEKSIYRPNCSVTIPVSIMLSNKEHKWGILKKCNTPYILIALSTIVNMIFDILFLSQFLALFCPKLKQKL